VRAGAERTSATAALDDDLGMRRGIAIDLAKPHLDATSGYQILWPVCALPILGVIPLLVRLMQVEDARAPVQPSGAASPLP